MTNKLHPLQQISFNHANQVYVVEASAGTGKTWTIERLYIKALLEASQPHDMSLPLSVDNILVVTFTNDATDELKQRISEQIQLTINQVIYLHHQTDNTLNSAENNDIFVQYLLARQQSGDFRKDVTILTRALQNFDSAAIYTIHGFCNRVLQDYQFECGTNGEFDLVANKSAIMEELVSEFLRGEIINSSQFKQNLDVVLNNLSAMFTGLDYNLSLSERISAKLPKDLFSFQAGNYVLKFNLNVSPDLALLTNQELTSDEQRLGKAQFMAYLSEWLANKYALACHKNNSLSYDELIQIVADSLQNSSGLADKIFRAFPVAFIDEFQDTDALQWQIFSTIYHLTMNRRGSVVVVGDPKQAIYRFRGADVDTYLQARTQIAQSLELESNFRSHQHIMNFINQLFSLENQRCSATNSFLGNSIAYHAVEACGSSKLVLPSAVQLNQQAQDNQIMSQFYDAEVQIVAINGATADERKKKLLASLTLEILALLKADPTLIGKIAILVTKNREASEIVAYLRKYGVKAAELKLGNIFATSSAHDLLRILSAVNDLTNRKNLLLALSSTLFNINLIELAVTDDTANPTLERWQKNFSNYKEIWEHSGLISLIYALQEDIIAMHETAVGIFTHRELANLWQLAELLNKTALKLHNNGELLFWFKAKIAAAENNLVEDIDGNNEELVRLDNDDEQIIITTQHKAKGLEYEILFCPYFKSGIQLDGQYDYNYRRPFFSTYRDGGISKSELILDSQIAQQIVVNDNKEAHRLNYVALTRAKSRLYIYLKHPTISRMGKYNSNQRPDKLVELFGYNKDDISDDSHLIFSYPQFFGDNPELALKQPQLMPGVVAYNRNFVSLAELDKLRFVSPVISLDVQSNFNLVAKGFRCVSSYSRQSYSGLASSDHESGEWSDYYVKNEHKPVLIPEYRHSILRDPKLKGATFGTLFHELCENYPFSLEQLQDILHAANIEYASNDYVLQLSQMLNEAFNYPLFNEISLENLQKRSQHELEFNLTIANNVSLCNDVAHLIGSYFGVEHPFALACRTLKQIERGFLIGFIDLFFENDGKYWVLDYKTNSLAEYGAPENCFSSENALIESMAEHHYYLQYLLYLVAVKRYLEQRLQITDGCELLGGALYYYVRGIYTLNPAPGDGVYLDCGCQQLVSELDELFKSSASSGIQGDSLPQNLALAEKN